MLPLFVFQQFISLSSQLSALDIKHRTILSLNGQHKLLICICTFSSGWSTILFQSGFHTGTTVTGRLIFRWVVGGQSVVDSRWSVQLLSVVSATVVGGLWWSVVVCGGLWWSVVVCGGLWSMPGRLSVVLYYAKNPHRKHKPWELDFWPPLSIIKCLILRASWGFASWTPTRTLPGPAGGKGLIPPRTPDRYCNGLLSFHIVSSARFSVSMIVYVWGGMEFWLLLSEGLYNFSLPQWRGDEIFC